MPSEEVAMKRWGSGSPETGLRIREAAGARKRRRRRSLEMVWWRVGEDGRA